MCIVRRPKYIPHTEGGILTAVGRGDGYAIAISWVQAYADSLGYSIAYNIYFSTFRADVFTEGPKLVSIDPGVFVTEISEFTPGDTFFFAVRATEYDPTLVNLSLLPDAGTSKMYSEGMLLSDMSEGSSSIPISDIDQFPAFGVVQIGTELIQYGNKDIPNNLLLGLHRGFDGTKIRLHQTDGYDGYDFQEPLVYFWKGYEEPNEVVFQEVSSFAYPNYPRTNIDGYKIVGKDLLTTQLGGTDAEFGSINFLDGGTSQESQTLLPAYDYAGWHRTDPVALLRGDCIGTYYGGEQYCADGYLGAGRVLRGLPIQNVNAQRQEVLLNTTGESVVLVRRLWTGTRCNCYLSSVEHPDDRCPNCFIPGTLVRTELGYRKIEDIVIGDKVLTHDGSYQKVTQTFINNYDGYLQGITTSITPEAIWATPEHPFLTLRGQHNKNISRECGPKCDNFISQDFGTFTSKLISTPKLLPSNNFWARITNINNKRISLGTFSTKIVAQNKIDDYIKNNFINEFHHKLDWDDAINITENDWLVSKYNNNIKDIIDIEIPIEYIRQSTLTKGKNKFIVDQEFLWMIGLFLAEGSSSSQLNFALHKDEIKFQERLIIYFAKYGYNAKIRKSSVNGITVEIYSRPLARWFASWLGRGCHNKHVPEEFMSLPNHKIQALIQGIYDGDGNKSCHEIGQTSKILTLQLIDLLHKIGKQPLVRLQESKKLTSKGNKRKPCYIVSWEEDTFNKINRKGRWIFNNELLTKVNKIEQKYYSGLVYNLEVENNHTYVVQNIISHNCFGVGFVAGYEQFVNPRRSDGRIMVRFGPTDDDLQFQDAGLESTFIPDCWTIVVPAVKDRDFIIRFNEDGTDEFRYEVLNVTRNKLLNQSTGAQKFKAQRVRKTDPINMWRAIRSTATMPQLLMTTIGLVPGPGGIPPHTHNIVINENIVNLSQVNQTTSVVQFHDHQIINGVIQMQLGHNHTIILP